IAKDCLQMQPEDRPRDASVLAVRITEYIESVETKLQASEVERATEAARADDEKKLRRISLVMAGAVLLLGAVGMIMQHLHAGELEALNGKLLVQARTEMRLRNVAVAAKDKAEAAEKESRIARLKADSSRADSELARSESEAVSEFLIGLFEDADPIARTERAFGAQRRGEGELLAVEVVNRGRNKLKTELLTQPRVRAVLLDKIGNVYLSIGKVDDGEALMREAAILRLEEFGPQSLEYAETLESLGVLNLYRHDLEAANDAFTKSLAIRRSTPSKNKLLIAKTLLNLGVMHSLRADYELAEPFLKECLQLRLDYYQKDGVPSDHMDVATVQFLLGKVYIVKDELENARTLLQQAATTTDRLQGNNGFSAILSLFSQAQMLEKLGTFGKANALAAYQQMDEKAVKLFGEEHLLVAFGRSFFGKFLYANKEYEQAIAMFRYVIRIYERELGPNSTVIAKRLIDLTRALRYAGQREAAKESIRKSAQIFRTLETPHRSGVDHAVSLHIYGAVLDDLGDREQGKQLLLESFESLHKNELKTSSRGTMLARDYAAMLLTFEVAGPTFRAHLGTGETAEINFELATKWAGAIDAQKKASEALSATEILMQERFENQAVLRLTDAVAAGFNDKSQIEENPAFNSVKDRADFQALLKTIAE
ncbi:MAG: tetratricopeptide repeat protein, partial [Rubripirellula sp.]|nr:tetratricopeptide repeat protein [Rubripirellula sp.]